MIYSYIEKTDSVGNLCTLIPPILPENQPIPLGEIGQRKYVFIDDNYVLGEQNSEIQCKKHPTLTDQERVELLHQGYALEKQNETSKAISKEVGDTNTLLNNLIELCEFTTVAVCAILADRSGDIPLSKNDIAVYGARAKIVLDSISNGVLTLRSAYVSPESMIKDIMPQYSKVQQLYAQYYLTPLKGVGLL